MRVYSARGNLMHCRSHDYTGFAGRRRVPHPRRLDGKRITIVEAAKPIGGEQALVLCADATFGPVQ